MMEFDNSSLLSRLLLGVIGAVVLVGAAVLLFQTGKAHRESSVLSYVDKKLAREKDTYQKLHFDLVDPDQAPEAIRSMARLGYQTILHTRTYASDYVGSKLDCTSCHFAGGDTTGGAGGGISLAGCAAKYPAYDSRDKKVVDLSARINYCFERSMNGTPLPLNSELMTAIVTYLHWIAKDIPIYSKVPWLGLKPLTTQHRGDIEQGKRTYSVYCALCHRDNGEGDGHAPPVQGPNSFNKAAGFGQIATLASFIYWNMPYLDATPVLTQEEAMDVAAYILSQSRPGK